TFMSIMSPRSLFVRHRHPGFARPCPPRVRGEVSTAVGVYAYHSPSQLLCSPSTGLRTRDESRPPRLSRLPTHALQEWVQRLRHGLRRVERDVVVGARDLHQIGAR